IWSATTRSTPTRTRACRPGRSPAPGSRSSRPRSTRRPSTTFTSWPATTTTTGSPPRWPSTTRRWPAIVSRAPAEPAINRGAVSAPSPATATPSPAAAPVAFPWLYGTLRPLLRALLDRSFGLTVEGRESLPVRPPYLLAANHHNYLDGIVLGCAVPAPVAF